MSKYFGTPAGVVVGQAFASRNELSVAGVHRPPMAGISGTRVEGADSIVVSGGYPDDEDHGEYIIYTGHGGRDPRTHKQVADQSADDPGNAGLITSWVGGLPVRVSRGAHAASRFAPRQGYEYAGLYEVTSYWTERGRDGFVIQRFRLDRLSDPSTATDSETQDQVEFRTTTISRRIRDSAASRRVKATYANACQICGTCLVGVAGRRYSEGAHVRPLGRPHLGPDDESNILCLCPNHHTQFDIGGLFVSDDLTVTDVAGNIVGQLTFSGSHSVDPLHFDYHRSLWSVSPAGGI
ncbi:HNH endonuclease [Leifsonia shinshuensis]|uniref:HNH endonuclease n=1 Tax=Leifsonia shinshuensis TaxID=150026 RepID=A0A7G6Y8X1_9MICO|nr:HNH endonuclease [Leifsonia shinshuensis]